MNLQESTERVFEISRLFDAGAVDRNAALFRLSAIHDNSTQARLRWLCVKTAERIGGVPLHMQPEFANG